MNDLRKIQQAILFVDTNELIEYMSKLDIDIQEVVVTTVLERLLDNRQKLTLFSEIAGEQTRKFIENLN